MHSFLVISKDKDSRENKVSEILKENNIDIFDQSFFSFEKAAGIEEIKKIAEKLYLKPFRSDKKALILDLSLGISTEAQNALLKTLEEPPANTIIIINGVNKEEFLPTILSRCQVFEFRTEENDEDFTTSVMRILKSGEGDRMQIASEFGKDRETAIRFTQGVVLSSSRLLKTNPSTDIKNLMKSMDQAYSTLKNSNVNPRFILENTVLSM